MSFSWSTAMPDWSSRIVDGRSLCPPPVFPESAEHGLSVFKQLRISDIPGRPTLGEAGRPWIFDFVSAVFGGYDPDAERQVITEYFLCVSKKNAKSTLAAGIMMTALILNARHSAEFLILAPTKEVAGNSFEPAAKMADMVNDEETSAGGGALFRVYRREKRIVHLGTGAELKVIAANEDVVTGTKATAVLVDELWLFGSKSGAASMLLEATGGLAARPEGFVVYLSTMASDAPEGVFKEKLNLARLVRDGGVEDNTFLPVIYEFPEEYIKDNVYRDPKYFYITNPNMGASVNPDYIVNKYRKAEQAGEAALRDFEAKHLNVEVSMALRSDGWRGAMYWQGATDPTLSSLDALLRRSDVAVVGIDNGGLDDLMGLCVLGRDAETRHWLAWCHAWCHTVALEQRAKNAPKYRDLEAAGNLTIVDDLVHAAQAAAAICEEVEAAGLLTGIGLDEYGAVDITDALRQRGFDEPILKGVSQGFRLKGSIQATEIKLANRTLRHGGQDLMAYCVANAKIVVSGNAVMITKAAAGTAKIDPLIAMLNAVALMAHDPQPVSVSYEPGSMYL